MAEFCLECWNKLNNTKHTEKTVKISKYLDLCEGCGEYKKTIDKFRPRKGLLQKLINWK